MKYTNDDLKLSFSVVDRPTVRQQLEYMGAAVTLGGKDLFLALWRGALVLIQDWECESIPDPHKLDLEKVSDLKVTEAVTWAGMRVREFVNSLDELPKN